MLSKALEYPTKGEEVARTYVIAGFLTLINILIIPLIFLMGYYLRVGRETIRGTEEVPRFDNFKELFFDGLKVLLIGIAFLIPGAILLSLGEAVTEVNEIAGALIVLMGSMTHLVLILGLPIGWLAFADKGRVKAAFRVQNFRYILTKQYWIALLSSIGVGIVSALLLAIVSFVLIITIIGILFVPFIILAWNVYIYLFYVRIFGVAYRELEYKE